MTSHRARLGWFILSWALAGAVGPLILLTLDILPGNPISNVKWLALLSAFLWPFQVLLWLAPPGRVGVLVNGYSIALNCVLYAAVGRVVWAIFVSTATKR